MKSFAIISLFATIVLAQSEQSTLIPSGISAGCQSALQSLDTDTSFQSCLSSIVGATAGYVSGGKTTTLASMTASLDSLCGSTTCSETVVRPLLSNFYQSCSVELTSNINQDVLNLYQVIYAVFPLRSAVCTKDDSGDYCATQIASRSSGIDQNSLSTPLSNDGSTVNVVNIPAYAQSNLLFLFLNPTLNSTTLCTSCTSNIMTSYISYGSDIPYGPALAPTQLLGGQTALYNAIQSTCGKNFLSGAVQAAGGVSNNGPLKTGGAMSLTVSGPIALTLSIASLGIVAFL
jgi:hypothetical protein